MQKKTKRENNFKIPSNLTIFGKKITIETVQQLLDNKGRLGESDFLEYKILLEKDNNICDLHHTFLHELVHFILYEMSEKELVKNEKFVNIFSGLLHEALTTSKYREE